MRLLLKPGTKRDRVIASVILRVRASIRSSSTYDRRTEDVVARTTGIAGTEQHGKKEVQRADITKW